MTREELLKQALIEQAKAQQKNASSNEPKKNNTKIAGMARAVLQGLSFGTADEAEAALRTLMGDETYADNLSDIRSEIKDFAEKNPKTALGLELAGSLPTAIAGGAGLARLGVKGAAKIAGLEGAAYAAGSAEGDAVDRAKAAAVGGVVSAGTGKLADAILPRASDAAKSLLKSGARLTPGQTVGGSIKKLEEAATSIPVVGNIIESAQDLAVKDFNRGALNKALVTLGKTVPKRLEGNDAFEFARNEIDKAYADIIPKLKISNLSDFQASLVRIIEDNADLPDSMNKQLIAKIDKSIGNRIKKGGLSGSDLKDIDSSLGQQAVEFVKSADPNQRQLGRALFETQTALRKSLTAENPDVAKQYGKVRMAFANLVPIQNAVVRSSLQGGVFTPSQLNTAIRSTDRSPGKIRVARGDAPMQELAQQAQETVGRELGNSGTVDRGLAALAARNPAAAALYGIPAAAATGLIYSNPIGRGVGRGAIQAPSLFTRSAAPALGAATATAEPTLEQLRLLEERFR